MSNPHRRARRAKVRNKTYKPKPVHAPMLIASQLVLGPVEAIVERLEINGTIDVDGSDNPVFQDGNGEWYSAADAIEGVIWHFEMQAVRHNMGLPLDGLRELHIAFKYRAQVQASTIRKLSESLPVLRRAMALADGDDQLDLLHQTQIKAAMEAGAA